MSHISGTNTPSDELMYSERPDWTDVVPIPQYEPGVTAIAPIFYSPEYKDATDYFRGIVKTGEKSERVLKLTEDIIWINPAHYSVWQYRYRTLLALNSPLDVELKLMDDVATQFMKTYQVWHHRRLLLTNLTSPSSPQAQGKDPIDLAFSELEFIASVLKLDSKNYHTWSYRQWLLAHFDDELLWLGEMAYIDDLLVEDVRNNSAWHHRFFVVYGRGPRTGATGTEAKDILAREIRYVKDKIALAPNNASTWNYLRGVLDHTKTSFSELISFTEAYTKSTVPVEEVVDLDNPKPSTGAVLPAVPALDFLAEARVREGGESVLQAEEIWKSLAEIHDTMRKKYWEYRIKEALAQK